MAQGTAEQITHDIQSVDSGTDLQSSAGDIVPRNILDSGFEIAAMSWLEISTLITAPVGSAANPELQLYFQDALFSNQFLEGEVLTLPADKAVAASTTRYYRWKPIYVGDSSTIAIALKSCPDGTRIKIVARRKAFGRL